MTLSAPPIDSRTSDHVVQQLLELLQVYTGDWSAFRPEKGASLALIRIFARFSELVIERLNHVPEKNLLAFLDMIGASKLPPQPARVPLTFSPVDGSIVDGLVPAGTQVAAVPSEDDPTPIIFETEEELVVTAARLTSLFVHEPRSDQYADNGFLINSVSAAGVPAFQGNQAFEHLFYLGHETLFSDPGLQQLRVDFQASQPAAPFQAQWERWDGLQWTKVAVSLTTDGEETNAAEKYLTIDGRLFFKNISPLPRLKIAGFDKGWLRCRLLTPIRSGSDAQAGSVSDEQLPEITVVNLTATAGTPPARPLSPEAAFSNTTQVDATKDFFPFGERPRVGDTLYLAHREAFSRRSSTVTLNINPTAGQAPPVKSNPRLSWEFWDGQTWSALGQVDQQKTYPGSATDFNDTTKALTANGKVSFTLPAPPEPVTVNGLESFWIRVRIVSGNYGEEAHYKLKVEGDPSKGIVSDPSQGYAYVDNDPAKGYIIVPSTFRPPSISSITIAYTLTRQAWPEVVLAYNDDLVYEVCAYPCKPFRRTTDPDPTIYLGFTLPRGLRSFPNSKISIYAAMGKFKYGETSVPAAPHESAHRLTGAAASQAGTPQLVWEYSDGVSWSGLTMRDSSENLSGPGLIEFLAPPDFAERLEFGVSRYWLRAVWKSGDYLFNPVLHGVLLNTVMAAHAVSMTGEVLGSSDASKNQLFRTTRTPVLEGQQLDVREPEIPSADERPALANGRVGDVVQVIVDDTGRPAEIWVRWSQVPDFYGSGPRDRHYVLDNLMGEVRFGDGFNGLPPPRGTGNVRMTLYKTGGGEVGNKPAGAITQLKTTVPYVDRVVNYLDATGGSDAESDDSLLDRAPRMLRHGQRAVTVEDYEDLAMLASPEVARARCVPLENVITDEESGQNGAGTKLKKLLRNGTVSVIIVPRSTEPQPSPAFELIERTEAFIGQWQSPLVELIVAGPEYVGISVAVEVAPASLDGAGKLKLAIAAALSAYLHPLTGGADNQGWDFGRYPHESNLYSVVESLPGVDHVNNLTLSPARESDEVRKAGKYFLVYSGTHTITLRFEEK